MRIFIGPYKNWYGPYQISYFLRYVGVSEDRCDKIGEYLYTTWLNKFLNWIDEKRSRKIKIEIHNYDIWNLDYTLSLIILPALKLFREQKQGIPHLSAEKELLIPSELRSKSEDYDEKNNLKYEVSEKQWNSILDEMIFSFEHIVNEDGSWEEEKKNEERVSNGLKLFGIFYRNLWD